MCVCVRARERSCLMSLVLFSSLFSCFVSCILVYCLEEREKKLLTNCQHCNFLVAFFFERKKNFSIKTAMRSVLTNTINDSCLIRCVCSLLKMTFKIVGLLFPFILLISQRKCAFFLYCARARSLATKTFHKSRIFYEICIYN